MKKLHYLALASLLLPLNAPFLSPAASAPSAQRAAKASPRIITQSAINAILTSVDKAANRQDVDGVCAPLAPEFTGRLDLQGLGSFTFNRAEYKSHLKDGFRVMKNYRYKRSNTRIAIAKNGRSARVTATIHEAMEINGRPLRGVTQETSIFQVQGNRIVVTSIHAVGQLTQ